MNPQKHARQRTAGSMSEVYTLKQAERLKVADRDFPLTKPLLERVFLGKGSPRQAIKAKCIDCCCWQREEVALCTAEACPLWRYRPFQPKNTSTTRQDLPSEPRN